MGKMKQIAIELQEAEETIQRGIHIVEYLENKLKRKEEFIGNLREQMTHMQTEMQEQNTALRAVKVILDEYIQPTPTTEEIDMCWEHRGSPGIGKSYSVEHTDLKGFPDIDGEDMGS